jgi:prepilin-type N-terminal cleavage/methylation domain-containing protein
MSIINNSQKNILQNFSRCIFFWKENTEDSKREKLSRTRAFTLIEIMVSVALFAIVVMISMTAILSIVDSNKKAQSMKSVMNNLNFALETMTRSIKTGGGLDVSTDFDGRSIVLTTDQGGDTVLYSLGVSAGPASASIVRVVNGGEEEPITAPEVVIEKLQFDSADYDQPSVTIIVKGHVKMNERVSSDFNIQTTVTQRAPETF